MSCVHQPAIAGVTSTAYAQAAGEPIEWPPCNQSSSPPPDDIDVKAPLPSSSKRCGRCVRNVPPDMRSAKHCNSPGMMIRTRSRWNLNSKSSGSIRASGQPSPNGLHASPRLRRFVAPCRRICRVRSSNPVRTPRSAWIVVVSGGAWAVEYVPASFKVIQHVRPCFICMCCDCMIQQVRKTIPFCIGSLPSTLAKASNSATAQWPTGPACTINCSCPWWHGCAIMPSRLGSCARHTPVFSMLLLHVLRGLSGFWCICCQRSTTVAQ